MKPYVPGIDPSRIIDNVPEDYDGPLWFMYSQDFNIEEAPRTYAKRVERDRWRRFQYGHFADFSTPDGELLPEWRTPLLDLLDGSALLIPDWDIRSEPTSMSSRVHDVFVSHGETQDRLFIPYDTLRPDGLPPIRRFFLLNRRPEQVLLGSKVPNLSPICDLRDLFVYLDTEVLHGRHHIRAAGLRYVFSQPFLEALGDVFDRNVVLHPMGVMARDEWEQRQKAEQARAKEGERP